MSRITFKLTIEPDIDHPLNYSVIGHGIRGTATFTNRVAVNVPATATQQQEADLLVETIDTVARMSVVAARDLLDRVPGRESRSGDPDTRCLTCNEKRDRHMGKQHPFEVAA